MKLTKYEQSGFILESDNGYRLAWDIASFTKLEDVKETAPVDAFIVSHIHPDHFSAEHIRALGPKTVYMNSECAEVIGEQTLPYELEIIKPSTVLQLEDITVTCFEADHGPNVGAPVKDNMGFIIDNAGRKIYFAGDMFNPSGPSAAEMEVDIALIPVGGFYTFGPQEALNFIKSFKTLKTLVPIHYELKPETCPEFVKLAATDLDAAIEILQPGQSL